MQNRKLGLSLAALAVVLAAALFVVLRDEGDADGGESTVAQSTTTTTTPDETTTQETTTREQKPQKPEVATIVVQGGEPVGGLQDLRFVEGEQIRFRVESDTEDEIHLHGYDVTEAVAPGDPAEFDLEATIPGVFEAELHHAVTQIAEIRVDP